MPYLKVRGNRIFYSVRTGGQKNLVLLHGAGGNHLNWYYQLEHLKDFFNLYAVDLPGHGNSGGSPCSSILCYAEFLEEFIRKLNLTTDKLVLVGHSMGGLIIEEYIKNGETPNGVVLISSSYRIEKRDPPESSFEFCRNLFYSEEAIERCLKTADIILSKSKSALECDLKAVSDVNYEKELQKFGNPVLLIQGEKDKLVPLEDILKMKEVLPLAKLYVVKDAGHMVMIEKAREVSEVMLEWLLKEV